jgi:hypothetical protein
MSSLKSSTQPDIPTHQCEVDEGREMKTLRFYCCYCRQWHSHGWPFGHRLTHCATLADMAAHPRGCVLTA